MRWWRLLFCSWKNCRKKMRLSRKVCVRLKSGWLVGSSVGNSIFCRVWKFCVLVMLSVCVWIIWISRFLMLIGVVRFWLLNV